MGTDKQNYETYLTINTNGLQAGKLNVNPFAYEPYVPLHAAVDITLDEQEPVEQVTNYMELINQNTGERYDVDAIVDEDGYIPDKIIFNGTTTIAVIGDKKYVVKCGDEDVFNPTFGFLYTYFLMHTGLSKTQAAKFFKIIEDSNLELPVKKEKEVEKVVKNKKLTLDEYEKEMRQILDDIIFDN